MAPNFSEKLPLLVFTCGDPAGIGPEAVVLALRGLRRFCRPLLVGGREVWTRVGWRPGLAPLLDTGLGLKTPPYGRATREGGRISFAALRLACRLVMRGLAKGIVTAPISKRSWDLAGIAYRDHTEYFIRELGAGEAQMVLGSPEKKLWCVLATRHIPLSRVPSSLSVARILSAARSLRSALGLIGVLRPRLGLCALNPHAGEEGLLGSEERKVLAPAAARARRKGIHLQGPVPADTAWRRHLDGGYDALVALYHDQALIPLKAAAGLGVVNWTVGLPFVRTSPGHGTAFDIAGKGKADFSATAAAAELAASLCR